MWTNSGALAPLNVWSHVAVTYNGAEVKTYLNGVLVQTVAASGPIQPRTTQLRIGGRQYMDTIAGFRQNFDGRIDDVRIYDLALSGAGVTSLYDSAFSAGGSGGTAFGPFMCAAGEIATALRGSAGQDLDRIELMCTSDLGGTTSRGVAGTAGGTDFGTSLTAPNSPGPHYLTGIFGEVRPAGWLDTLGVQFKSASGLFSAATNSSTKVATPDGGPAFNVSCPTGQVIRGISGRAGTLIDQLVLHCRPVPTF